MGRGQRGAYRETILATQDRKLYTQASLADLAVTLNLIKPEERLSAKTGFRRFTKGIKPDEYAEMEGMGGRYPAWYGKTLKHALLKKDGPK